MKLKTKILYSKIKNITLWGKKKKKIFCLNSGTNDDDFFVVALNLTKWMMMLPIQPNKVQDFNFIIENVIATKSVTLFTKGSINARI